MFNLTRPSSDSIADRILDAFPSGSYALTGLLRLLDVVETDQVSTAAVECRLQPRLLINSEFVDKHATTSEKLLMLVLHELHHVLLGHTTLFPRTDEVQNFVFDAVINGIVCRMFPKAEYTSFFTDFYQADRFPECLLRPPPGWPDVPNQPAPALALLPEAHRARVQEIHHALYSEGGASYHEVYEALPVILNTLDQAGKDGSAATPIHEIPLMGGHDESGIDAGQLEQQTSVLFDIVRQLVEHWPQPPDPIKGSSLTDVLNRYSVKARKVTSNRAMLRSLIHKVAGSKGTGRIARIEEQPLMVSSPIPSFSRRTAVLQALGSPPLMFIAPIPWRHRVATGERVHIYLDVSGSMNTVLNPLYGAVLDCANWVFPRIHLFSTRIDDVSLQEMRAGKCCSTGGTDIKCVAEHLETHRIRRALMITDGYVGRPKGRHLDTLKRTRLSVAYLGSSIHKNDLANVANFTDILNLGASS